MVSVVTMMNLHVAAGYKLLTADSIEKNLTVFCSCFGLKAGFFFFFVHLVWAVGLEMMEPAVVFGSPLSFSVRPLHNLHLIW